jgi:alpha-tubulin suppressor-like RCC1 family protein
MRICHLLLRTRMRWCRLARAEVALVCGRPGMLWDSMVRSMAVVLVVVCSACSGSESVGPSGGTTLILSTTNVAFSSLAETLQIVASVQDQNGVPIGSAVISWSTSEGSVATVSSSGLVTSIGPGTANVSASSGSASGTVLVTVIQEPATLSIVSGAEQDGHVGDPLPAPVVVSVSDSGGHPIHGITITTFDYGDGAADSPTTGQNGQASVNWTLGTEAGDQNMRVEVGDLPAVLLEATANVAFTTISTGGHHSCGLDSSGTAYCWGLNQYGEIGDGSAGGTRAVARFPVLAPEPFTKVSAGGQHTCGIGVSGAGYCWGNNTFYQLGDHTNEHRTVATQMSDGLVFTQISVGAGYACGVTESGEGYCWGDGNGGRRGDPNCCISPSVIPTQVVGGIRFTQISASGQTHTCGVSVEGSAWCWGVNDYGQLGNGTTVPGGTGTPSTPVMVSGLSNVVEVSASGHDHTCARLGSGEVYCWGRNRYGALGDGSLVDASLPVRVSLAGTASSITTGLWRSCALLASGTPVCWGHNYYGQLGDGSTNDVSAPTPVGSTQGFLTLEAFGYHTCGVTISGIGLCWGLNDYGALGDNTLQDRALPNEVRYARAWR